MKATLIGVPAVGSVKAVGASTSTMQLRPSHDSFDSSRSFFDSSAISGRTTSTVLAAKAVTMGVSARCITRQEDRGVATPTSKGKMTKPSSAQAAT